MTGTSSRARPATRKNPLWLWAFALLVRGPVLLPLLALVRIGEWAEAAGDWLGDRMPGLRR